MYLALLFCQNGDGSVISLLQNLTIQFSNDSFIFQIVSRTCHVHVLHVLRALEMHKTTPQKFKEPIHHIAGIFYKA